MCTIHVYGQWAVPGICTGMRDEPALYKSPAALQVSLGWSKARTGSTERRLVMHCVTFRAAPAAELAPTVLACLSAGPCQQGRERGDSGINEACKPRYPYQRVSDRGTKVFIRRFWFVVRDVLTAQASTWRGHFSFAVPA